MHHRSNIARSAIYRRTCGKLHVQHSITLSTLCPDQFLMHKVSIPRSAGSVLGALAAGQVMTVTEGEQCGPTYTDILVSPLLLLRDAGCTACCWAPLSALEPGRHVTAQLKPYLLYCRQAGFLGNHTYLGNREQ